MTLAGTNTAPFMYHQAPWRLRFAAALIDSMILGTFLMTWIFVFVFSSFLQTFLDVLMNSNGDPIEVFTASQANMGNLLGFLIAPTITLSYYVMQEWFFGKTLGKRLMYIRVQSTLSPDRQISFYAAFMRDLLRYIDVYVVIFIAILQPNAVLKQRLGDLLASTIVVMEDDPRKTK